jgi:hypothetical protein
MAGVRRACSYRPWRPVLPDHNLQLTDTRQNSNQKPSHQNRGARNIAALAIAPTKRYARRYLV